MVPHSPWPRHTHQLLWTPLKLFQGRSSEPPGNTVGQLYCEHVTSSANLRGTEDFRHIPSPWPFRSTGHAVHLPLLFDLPVSHLIRKIIIIIMGLIRSDKSLKYECTSTIVDDKLHPKDAEVGANDACNPSGLQRHFIAYFLFFLTFCNFYSVHVLWHK